jgi:hypothetical protein
MRRTRRTARTSTVKTKYLNELETLQRELLAAQTGAAPSLLDVTGTGAGAGLSDAATCRTDQGLDQRLKEEYAKAAGELEKSVKEQDKNKLTSTSRIPRSGSRTGRRSLNSAAS